MDHHIYQCNLPHSVTVVCYILVDHRVELRFYVQNRIISETWTIIYIN